MFNRQTPMTPFQGLRLESEITRGDASLAPGYFIVAPLALPIAPLTLFRHSLAWWYLDLYRQVAFLIAPGW
jgi:hypothetical protein